MIKKVDKKIYVTNHLYIHYRAGENYEDAYLCVDDGEPDMNDLCRMSFTQANQFVRIMKNDLNIMADNIINS